MISKRLLSYIKEKKLLVYRIIFLRLLILLTNIGFIYLFSSLILSYLNFSRLRGPKIYINILFVFIFLLVKLYSHLRLPVYTGDLSNYVKHKLRKEALDKMFSIRNLDKVGLTQGDLLQNLTEGIEQLDLYYSRFLPQLVYSLLSPIILAIVLSFFSVKVAISLLVIVPLIPLSLALIGKNAKRISQKYWGEFSDLSNDFLESIEGLTLLKIYQADVDRADWMKKRAADFRAITMKVLSMQLNSIWVMDFLAYGGAGVGIYVGLSTYQTGGISLLGLFMVIMLSIEYFLPLRLLGSFFHVAINGVSASRYIFALLDLKDEEFEIKDLEDTDKIFEIRDLNYSYDKENLVLKNISLDIEKGMKIGICGPSGCGKSTLASILNGKLELEKNTVTYRNKDMSMVDRSLIFHDITTVSYDSYIFKLSLRDNLSLYNKNISDEAMWKALEEVNMKDYFESENGLDTMIDEQGSNMSGGQKQRIAFARAILSDSSVYILDEATSNIDPESEKSIIDWIYNNKGDKTWILISHRIQNLVSCDLILLLDKGEIVERGTHEELLKLRGRYENLYKSQRKLENLSGGNYE